MKPEEREFMGKLIGTKPKYFLTALDPSYAEGREGREDMFMDIYHISFAEAEKVVAKFLIGHQFKMPAQI